MLHPKRGKIGAQPGQFVIQSEVEEGGNYWFEWEENIRTKMKAMKTSNVPKGTDQQEFCWRAK
jgi:hypothetical protein